MTHEAAHEEGKRAARSFLEIQADIQDEPCADLLAFLSGYTECGAVYPAHVRGAADFYQALVDDLRAYAVAMEAAR